MTLVLGENKKPNALSALLGGLNETAPQALDRHFQQSNLRAENEIARKRETQELDKENDILEKQYGTKFKGIKNQKIREALLDDTLKRNTENERISKMQDLFNTEKGGINPADIPDDKIAQLGLYDQAYANSLRQQKQDALKQRDNQDQKIKDQAETYQIYRDANVPEEEARRRSLTDSPTTARNYFNKTQEKPVFEEEGAKLAAKASAETRDEIVREYNGALTSNARLNRQIKLAGTDKLPTPLMVATLKSIGLPLAVLANPEAEEYEKIETDHVRDISKVFPGQIKNFEIETYLKTIPGLLNSDKGKEILANNVKTLNEAKILRYNALKEILKENGGKLPPNVDIEINDRIGDKLTELAERYEKGITEDVEPYLPTVPMVDEQGNEYDIPYTKIQEAQADKLQFKSGQ